MTRSILLISALLSTLFVGCSSDRNENPVTSTAPPEQVKALSQADREKIATFEKELFDVEKLSKKALALVGNELKQVITGEKETVDASALVDEAKGEAKKSLDSLVAKAVPAKLPPWFTQNLVEAKKGFSAAYMAKIESFEAIKGFAEEKSPSALLEYKQKGALADKQFQEARERLAAVLTASGLPLKGAATTGSNSEK
ncbi:MAG: hypothetical protein EG828_04175 [Deltaproteobacteria bacterium]|nr:hypothetical protein [Deltaproteobacteria bacterium]